MTEQDTALEKQQYVEGLRAYLHHGGELALSSAYELGRRALVDGMGVLDMAALHHAAIEDVVLAAPPQERKLLLERAATFFNELLSPFEMSFRGYRVANENLRQMNQTLQEQTHELEIVNRELESFSYSVSHDLRGPLRAIDGFSHAVLETCGERLDPDAHRHLTRIRDATRRMAQLIDDLLGLAQVTRRDLHYEDVDLSAIARNIVERLQAAAPDREVDVAIENGVRAKGDGRLLTVLLENLLGNAWKFTGKQLHARIQFGATVADDRTVYQVRDNGAGFDMAYANKLFRPFSRLHSSQDFEGTGVGLATVQRIVRRHGGDVWAEAKLNGGASFSFTLGSRRP